MMKPVPFSSQAGASPGVALIVTLMMMSVMVMMVVGLAGVMRNEQAAAKNLTYQVLADQLAEIGARQAISKVLSNSMGTNGISLKATGPGWIICDGQLSSLFSAALTNNSGTNVSKNLEEIGTNSLILSLTTNSSGLAIRGSLSGSWFNMTQPGSTSPVGRYAWWVDDEGGKLNVNYTGPSVNNSRVFPGCTNFPFLADYVFWDPLWGNNSASAQRAASLTSRTNWIFTTESLKDTNTFLPSGNNQIGGTVYRRIKGQVTAWASNVNLNPYGQARYGLTNLANPSTITDNTNFGALMEATFRNPNLTNTNNLIVFRQNFEAKYGNGDRGLGGLVLRQAMANAYEAIHFNPTNLTNAPLQSSNLVTIAGTGITNVPRDYQGLSPASLYLNEICAQAFFSKIDTNQCQFQIWVYVELINLTSISIANDMICVVGPGNTDTNQLTISGTTAKGNFTKNLNFNFYKTNGSSLVNIGGTSTNVSPYGLFNNRAWFVFGGKFQDPSLNGQSEYQVDGAGTMSAMTINNFQIGNVVLLRKFNRGRNIIPVDWVQGPLPAMNFGAVNATTNQVPIDPGASGFFSYAATDTGAPGEAPALGTGVISFSKIDPRFRVFPGWVGTGGLNAFSAWTNRGQTYGADNRLFPASLPGWSLRPDRVAAATNFSDGSRARIWWMGTNLVNTNSPLPAWSASGTNLPASGLLGWIHTGLPWRTFALTAQGSDPEPPDWLLVDLFGPGNPTNFVPAINLNTQYQALTNAAVTNRVPMAVSLLANLTNNAPNPSFGSQYGFPFWMNRWSSNDLSFAMTNLASSNRSRWITQSWWDNKRQGQGPKTNPAFFLFRGELAEIRGVGDVVAPGTQDDVGAPGTQDDDREAALAVIGDLVTPRSDTFSVWSAGQGLVVVTNSSGTPIRTNVMAEVRKQTVFQRIPQFNASGQVTDYKIRVLYTRNHVME